MFVIFHRVIPMPGFGTPIVDVVISFSRKAVRMPSIACTFGCGMAVLADAGDFVIAEAGTDLDVGATVAGLMGLAAMLF